MKFNVVVPQPIRKVPLKSVCNPNIELISSVIFKNFSTIHSTPLDHFAVFVNVQPYFRQFFVDLEMDFSVEVDVDDVAEFGG